MIQTASISLLMMRSRRELFLAENGVKLPVSAKNNEIMYGAGAWASAFFYRHVSFADLANARDSSSLGLALLSLNRNVKLLNVNLLTVNSAVYCHLD